MAHVYARPHHMLQTEEEVLDIVEDDPSTSTREIARQVNVSQHKVWKTLRENQLYPFHNNLTPGPDYTNFKCRSCMCPGPIRFSFFLIPNTKAVTRDKLKCRDFRNYETAYDVTFTRKCKEQDIETMAQPLTCLSCEESLKLYSNFVKTFKSTEEKLHSYCQREGTSTKSFVNLKNLLKFLNKNPLHSNITSKKGPGFEDSTGVCSKIQDDIRLETDREKLYNQTNHDSILLENRTMCDADVSNVRSNTQMENENAGRIDDFGNLFDKEMSVVQHFLLEVYKCETCNFHTKYRDCINRHLLLHKNNTEVETFKCEFCGFITKHKRSLQRHLLVHDSSKLEVFKCNLCDYSAKHKSYLNKHLLNHKPASETILFRCDVCPFQTRQKYNLTKHLLIHMDSSEVELFRCDMCAFETKYKTALTRHVRMHKVEVYECAVCDFKSHCKSDFVYACFGTSKLCEGGSYVTKCERNIY
ncbi:hypothetical protein NQ317_011799 [Molorchus minor]|uniref:C2H2-type domain-containing protein n=1 Tax=Molorchus minor TaxID=1323400 RepID=A0ABQ9J719_9CUCU|nr:hypothetical protein NQ317_011799 [Molorchus minor]